ncbi:hypothetical protein DFQ04_0894 [Algoriphagus boseongensis]|uniref:WD40 repeat protein n=1 Tax=Algoriphagus boseongensis TaxID=1442587 RepID=A0A4V3D2J0_9BACT|nr:hypothetical protein [Algoriphagus boseongensis]TDQ19077.1 hypothetical protein DFQ04_0894 [Algoriphagus boseongensis]
MSRIPYLLIILSFLSIQFVQAQTSFDLWVVDTEGKGSSLKLLAETAKSLTNRPEYDNQPNFINDSELVFSAADNQGNHDIILYSFRTGNFTNLSKTSDRSEYSPTLTDCKQYISAVVVEPDGKQRLWLYPINQEPAELLYDDIAPVGYYDWYDNKAAMFVLGEPNKLVYAWGKGNVEVIANNIDRSVKKRPRTAEITFLDRNELKESPEGNLVPIKTYDLKKKKINAMGNSLPGSQDLIWIDKNHLLMAKGNEVFIKSATGSEWNSIGKITSSTHKNITRMAYSLELNKLVIVMQRN